MYLYLTVKATLLDKEVFHVNWNAEASRKRRLRTLYAERNYDQPKLYAILSVHISLKMVNSYL